MRLSLYLAPIAALTLAACSSEPAPANDPSIDGAPPEGSAADMSPNMHDVIEAAYETGNYNIFLQAALTAGLAERLATTQGLTIFAPTDAAFEAVPNLGTLQNDPEQLARVLQLHVVPRELSAAEIPAGETTLETRGGEALTVVKDGDTISVTGPAGSTAFVTQADIDADNGVVHGIDAVLTPG